MQNYSVTLGHSRLATHYLVVIYSLFVISIVTRHVFSLWVGIALGWGLCFFTFELLRQRRESGRDVSCISHSQHCWRVRYRDCWYEVGALRCQRLFFYVSTLQITLHDHKKITLWLWRDMVSKEDWQELHLRFLLSS